MEIGYPSVAQHDTQSGTAKDSVLAGAFEDAVANLNIEQLRKSYWDRNECLVLPEFLPPGVVDECLALRAEELAPRVVRNFIPGHKKGGSVSYYLLREHAPSVVALYQSPALIDFFSRLVGAPLMVCPEDDPHSCALYYYTEPGDHIGFHYDTSYYKGARYTVLLGIVNRAPSCRLVCHFHKDDPSRETEEVHLATDPGTLVVFNGDKLYHAVSPLSPGKERVVLTLEYVTNQEMGRFQRLFSNLKDAFGYFGPAALFKRKR